MTQSTKTLLNQARFDARVTIATLARVGLALLVLCLAAGCAVNASDTPAPVQQSLCIPGNSDVIEILAPAEIEIPECEEMLNLDAHYGNDTSRTWCCSKTTAPSVADLLTRK